MPRSANTFDTLIVGAGAAGLAAAARLAQSGQAVCMLEARERLGGRIWTHEAPQLPAPIELGAELIHGRSAATLAWLNGAQVPIVDAAQSRWSMRGGRLQPADDLFAEMKHGLSRIARPRKDLAFADFLESRARRLAPRVRRFARALVEGFDAADATHASTLVTLEEWSSEGAADAPTFRPLGGYRTLVRALAGALGGHRVQTMLGTVVHHIRWRRGRVTIEATRHGQPFTAEAPRAIITLPLGILQRAAADNGAVRFTPPLTMKQDALAELAAGSVIKVILHFRRAFWEELDAGRYRNGAFFHCPAAPFPTLWSSLPMRTSLLSAWAAGPKAAQLAGKNAADLIRLALHSVELLFGRRTQPGALLESAYLHDWQADPFARGAYSYVTVGGAHARKTLAMPVQGTLYLAGEAADANGESGTVAGALQSGRRAAQQVLEGAARRTRRVRKKSR